MKLEKEWLMILMIDMKVIVGSNIRQFRKQKGLTQPQLADLIGKHESSIRKYEKGLTDIPNEVIMKIADVLEVPIIYFYEFETTINERVKILRKQLNLSQEEFGKAIGLSKSSISNIEKGTRNVTNKHIKLICFIFNVDELWLTTGTADENEHEFQIKTLKDYSTLELIEEIKRRVGEKVEQKQVSQQDETAW